MRPSDHGVKQVENIRLEESIRWLVVGLVAAVVYLLLAVVIQVFASLRGSPRPTPLLPTWLRIAVLAAVSSAAVPKPVNAETPQFGAVSDQPDDKQADINDVVLAGSIAANAGFTALLLRRRLAQIRTRRFGSAEGSRRSVAEEPVVKPMTIPDWSVLVQVLGPPVVVTARGERVTFEKGKALELLVWMTEHREVSTRSAARTALWDGMVKDSTFSNVVSEVRRSLNSSHTGDVVEWIPRTFTDELPLHPGVVTDAELLDIATKNFERKCEQSVTELTQRLSAVRNLPFSGADYAWADGEGITTSHVIKVVKAAVLLGEYAIENDDSELLFMATERGLRVLPGHEQLVSLRMRGHARGGNRTAIKYEWESYARAIASDSWAGAVPSSELEDLARELSQS